MNIVYYIIDVFTDFPFNGAQLAVFPDAGSLDDNQMQLYARELNLSESVFLSAVSNSDDTNARKMRIFSPIGERNFSGHASIAAGYVLGLSTTIDLSNQHVEISLTQNTGTIPVIVSRRADSSLFIQFSRKAEPTVDRFVPTNAQLADMLSLPEKDIANNRYNTLLVSCDYPYLIIPLRSFEAVRKAIFSHREWSNTVAPVSPASEILLFSTKSDLKDSNFHGRLVGPQIGVDEDPPIGSSMPAFAGYLSSHEHISQGTHSFVIDRGTKLSRKSVISVDLIKTQGRENEIRVGGPAVMIGEGKIIA